VEEGDTGCVYRVAAADIKAVICRLCWGWLCARALHMSRLKQ
jgi:hypothetical protein